MIEMVLVKNSANIHLVERLTNENSDGKIVCSVKEKARERVLINDLPC